MPRKTKLATEQTPESTQTRLQSAQNQLTDEDERQANLPKRRSARVQAQKEEEEARKIVYPSKYKVPVDSEELPPTIPSHCSFCDELSEFPQFPKLPFELREMIWTLAIPGPRTIRIVHDAMAAQQAESLFDVLTARAAPHKLPVILQVDKQSRAVGLTVYYPAFGFELDHPVMFNYRKDILLLKSPLAVASFHGNFPCDWDKADYDYMDEAMYVTHQNVRFLALGCSLWYYELFTQFQQLQEVILMTNDGTWPRDLAHELYVANVSCGYKNPTIMIHSKEGLAARMERALALNPF